VAVLLGLVVVALLGFAAPAFAGGQSDGRGQCHGRDDRPSDLVDELRGNLDRALPGRQRDDPGSDPAEEPVEPPATPVMTAARTAVPTPDPAVTEVAEVPSALAAAVPDVPVVGDLPVAAPAPSPAPVPDELPASAPSLPPPAAAVAPPVGAVSAPAGAPSSPSSSASSSSPASVPDAVPPPQIGDSPPPAPPAGDVGGAEQLAAPTGTAGERSFTALLALIAATLLFLAFQGRIDRRGPRRADRPGDYRPFR
jgi:hypothetical protein